MESTKKNAVTSSMVDLKAELFRKQEEFKRQKAAGSSFVREAKPERNTKGSIWNQQNAGVLARAKKDEASRTSEEDDVHIQSRKALEEKARLYDKLCNSSTIPEEDGSDYYLVDFQKKVIDSIVEDREAKRKNEAEDEAERAALAAVIPKPADPDEEWIDFKDSLGRDRRCMKKDLDHLMKQDRDLALTASRKTREAGTDLVSQQLPSLMSADMHREIMRQKWENEMKELQEKGQEEIHYSNVQFDEIRSHGVGFFQFSKDHEKREEQLGDLKKMREETVDEHSRKERIKDKRQAMMEARLAKVRQRRNLKEPAPEVSVKTECDQQSETIGPKLSEAPLASTTDDDIKKEEIEKQAEEKRKAHVREWDRGKHTDLPAKKNYVEVLRNEREPEFAPPSLYFEEPKNRQHQASDSQRIKRLHASLKTTNEEFASPTNAGSGNSPLLGSGNSPSSGSGNSLSLGRCDDTEDKTQGDRRPEEFIKEHTSSGPQISQMGEQLPETNPPTAAHQLYQTNGNAGIVNSWIGSYSGYENVSYYGDQVVQTGQYGQTGMHFENPGAQQHYYMSSQQQQDHYQWQPGQYTSSAVPHQQYHNVFGTGNQQLPGHFCSGNQQLPGDSCPGSQQLPGHFHPASQQLPGDFPPGNQQLPGDFRPGSQQLPGDFRNASLSTVSVGVSAQGTSMSASVDVEPRKPKIPKMAVVDTRFVKNEDMAPVQEMSVNPHSVTAIPYIPGSFTAAKQATARLYEESVVESGLKNQISGTPLLYTEDQLAKRELLQSDNID